MPDDAGSQATTAQCEPDWLRKTADRIHQLSGGYEFIWIPSFHYDEGIAKWRSYGFDRVVLQPNYLQGEPGELPRPTTSRLSEVTALVERWGLAGTEIELGPARNPLLASLPDPELTSARAYLLAAVEQGWDRHSLTVHYHARAMYDYAMGVRPEHREIYDSVYCVIRRARGEAILPEACPELAQALR